MLDHQVRERPLLSVLIASIGHEKTLETTLDSIARSQFDLSRIEVVVATSETPEPAGFPFHLELVRQDFENRSAAMNAALEQARGEYVLCSADDLLFQEDLISQHLAWHLRFRDESVAVLGCLAYSPDPEITPFMRYLADGGFQFPYAMIKDPFNVGPSFVYAPNISMRRETLRATGAFDERLSHGSEYTDLGILLAGAGVRLVHNRNAVGYRTRSVELRDFLERQEKVGRSMVHLRNKHPEFESGPLAWDLTLQCHMAYPQARYDLDANRIAELESSIDASQFDFNELWSRALAGQTVGNGLSEEDQLNLGSLQQLFQAYHRILQHHWALGFLDESMRTEGPAAVGRWICARLAKMQSSMQCRRAIESRMVKLGLPIPRPLYGRGDFLHTRIVVGLDSYDAAIRFLENYLNPELAVGNQQTLLVIERDAMSGEQVARLDQVTEVVCCDDLRNGVFAALKLAESDVVTVTDAEVLIADVQTQQLGELVFDRLPQASVLGGCLSSDDGQLLYGYRCADGEPVELLSKGDLEGPVEIDAAIAEYLVLRGSATRLLDEAPASGFGWHVDLCRQLARNGHGIFHLPELQGVRTAPQVVPALSAT